MRVNFLCMVLLLSMCKVLCIVLTGGTTTILLMFIINITIFP